MKSIFLVATLLFLPGVATAATGHVCDHATVEGVPVAWCIDQPPHISNPDVLYYLHGGSGNERSWTEGEDNQLIRKEWQKRGDIPPTVITISFGTEWILSEVPHDPKPALYRLFVDKLMPLVEAKIGGVKGRRLLKGESMGGFNAAQLLLKNPELFSHAALICPGISVIGPYSSPEELDSFFKRNIAYINKTWVDDLLNWSRWEFPSQDAWKKHDPLVLIRSAAHVPKLYVSCGKQDEYGFFKGAERFAQMAFARGFAVKWQPMPGGHCVSDANAIAKFLAR